MRFGIGRRDITPSLYTYMHGYAARRDTNDGVNDPLAFTAIVMEEGGRRALLGAADICTFPNDGSVPDFLKQVGKAIGCPADSVMLNASHTHGGPRIPGSSLYWRDFPSRTVEEYRDQLYAQVLEAAREAADNLVEGSLWYGEGKTRLPMNRRPERDGRVVNAPNPGGPVDDRMQLLIFRKATGEAAAVGVKVSCHPVATGAQHLITADWPGAWRAAFSNVFGPDVIPFFLQGAGADARPRHVAEGDRWRAMKHAELAEIGDELLAETLAILTGTNLRPVDNLTLQGKINIVQAPCEEQYTTREQLESLKDEGRLLQQYAEAGLERLSKGKAIPDQVAFQVQTLWLNRDLALIGLDVEPLCGLARTVEEIVAPAQAVLLGYTNGCVGYTPDTEEMKRGGYETGSYLSKLWSGPLKPGLEDLFASAVVRQAGG